MKCPKISSRILELVLLALIFLAVLAMWWWGWRWIDENVTASTAAESASAARGQFGDKFGAVNALFSGFAFAGIIFTIFLQRRDLRETHKAMSHERFDNTFFQLLHVHITISEKINVRGGYIGRQAFESFNEYLKSCDPDFHVFCALQKLNRDQIRRIIDGGDISRALCSELEEADVTNLIEARKSGVVSFNNFLDENINMHKTKIVAAYVKASSLYIDSFSHYFRNLYHILKFISESPLIGDSEKDRYSRFVRAQLSQVELVTLFYNSIEDIKLPGRDDMELGRPKMWNLLRRFDMLQNMNPRSLIHPKHLDIFNTSSTKEQEHAN